MREAWIKAGLALGAASLALVVSLAVGEVLLRGLSTDAFYPWAPGTRVNFRLPRGLAPGIRPETHFAANAMGIRSDPFTARQRYRILAIGGSTTECLLLDDSLAWPQLLEDELNQRVGSGQVWVGNAGRSGRNAAHHDLYMKHLLPQFPRIDAVIVMAGINDLQGRLTMGSAPWAASATRDDSIRLMREAFDELPRRFRTGTAYKRTEVWQRLRTVKLLVLKWLGRATHLQDVGGDNLARWRRHRQTATTIRDTLPDLQAALADYDRRLNAIADDARQRNVRLILVTQPALWRAGLPPELSNLLWLGGIGDFQTDSGREYYSVAALARGLDLFNHTMLDVCRERQIECIDVASALPKDTTVFYDDVHFNESGSRKVAAIIAEYLLAHDMTTQIARGGQMGERRIQK